MDVVDAGKTVHLQPFEAQERARVRLILVPFEMEQAPAAHNVEVLVAVVVIVQGKVPVDAEYPGAGRLLVGEVLVDDGQGSPTTGQCSSERSLVNTALSYRQAADVAKAAASLGKAEDAAHFRQLSSSIAQAFNARFLDATRTMYGSGRQVTSVLPLAFGMVPDDRVPAVGARLAETILDKDNGHLDTGIFGTRYLPDALARAGRVDVAKTILGQTTYPGFGYQISRGATTPWEQWTYESNMETHDHAMFAGINATLFTQFGGITPASPGYASITIAPQVPAGLARLSASIDTVRGTVSSSWTNEACTFALTATVPVNATATVSVPLFGATRIRATAGAIKLPGDTRAQPYSVGSGTWQFSVDRCSAKS